MDIQVFRFKDEPRAVIFTTIGQCDSFWERCVAHQMLVEDRHGGVILKSMHPELCIIDGEDIRFHFRICGSILFSREYIFYLFATQIWMR